MPTSLALGLEAARSDRDFRLVLGQELARVVSDDIARRAEGLDIALAGLITTEALEALPGELHRVEPLGTTGTFSPHVVGPVYLTRTRLPVSEEHAPTTMLSRVGLTEHGALRVLDRHLAVVDGVRIYGPPALVQDFVELSYPEWYQSVD